MKTCNCRNCGRVFTVSKPMPFCSGACRITYQLNQSRQTTQVGVSISDNSSTEQDH